MVGFRAPLSANLEVEEGGDAMWNMTAYYCTAEDALMTDHAKNAAVMWTGGKDSALALEEAANLGYSIDRLVTFVPKNADFKAHSLSILSLQSEATGFPLDLLEVGEPFFGSYRMHIRRLKEECGIDAVVTGDIDLVDGCPNWVRQCAEGTGVEVLTPLWDIRRDNAMERLLIRGYKSITPRSASTRSPM
jgi:diphthamide synthase (EF-2-diphthine--ammonia ligase)